MVDLKGEAVVVKVIAVEKVSGDHRQKPMTKMGDGPLPKKEKPNILEKTVRIQKNQNMKETEVNGMKEVAMSIALVMTKVTVNYMIIEVSEQNIKNRKNVGQVHPTKMTDTTKNEEKIDQEVAHDPGNLILKKENPEDIMTLETFKDLETVAYFLICPMIEILHQLRVQCQMQIRFHGEMEDHCRRLYLLKTKQGWPLYPLTLVEEFKPNRWYPKGKNQLIMQKLSLMCPLLKITIIDPVLSLLTL
jgi:hypothetical protein